jgi:rSAM/selenodomain-associated transferase 1
VADNGISNEAALSERSTPAFCGIAVMAKASSPGLTKTRLVPPLTFAEAAAFNTAFLRDVAANIAAANRGAVPVAGYMAYGPPRAGDFFAGIMPAAIGRFEAWHANFGDCLYAAIGHLFARGHAAAIVLNSDSPTLPTALLAEAAEVLASPGDRAVLGPSADGGYYLLGIKAPHRRLFEDIAWSTETVAEATLARAAEIGLDVHRLPAWYDVDDAASLRLLKAEVCDGASFAPGSALTPQSAPHTRQLLATLLASSDLAARLGEAPHARAAE